MTPATANTIAANVIQPLPASSFMSTAPFRQTLESEQILVPRTSAVADGCGDQVGADEPGSPDQARPRVHIGSRPTIRRYASGSVAPSVQTTSAWAPARST